MRIGVGVDGLSIWAGAEIVGGNSSSGSASRVDEEEKRARASAVDPGVTGVGVKRSEEDASG